MPLHGRFALMARTIAAATPPDRDRAVDAMRAIAIVGVLVGHWLVTSLVLESDGLRVESPLVTMSYLVPVTWVLQTLGLFFFVGGYANSRSLRRSRRRGQSYDGWMRARSTRLGKPVLVLLAAWIPVAVILNGLAVPGQTVHTLVKLAVSPLWFIAVYLVLTALTRYVLAGVERWGAAAALLPLLAVVLTDLIRIHGWLGVPESISWVSLVAGWLVPYQLGVAWERGGLRSRSTTWSLIALGASGYALLVIVGNYPASMVGVTGADRSNLAPPSLLVPALAAIQIGVGLTVLDRLRQAMARPATWAIVATLNRFAMTLFLWHLTALMAVTVFVASWRPLVGLHTYPENLWWLAARVGWLPAFAAVLALLGRAFARWELSARSDRPPAEAYATAS
ncbi:MAG: acyltransferase [Sporichthyaceae bacterium]|nr:acyltransferase [Sporichthyaceae bacterium]